MMKKVIWYCNHYSGHPKTTTVGRAYYLAQSLTQLDCEVSVIHASFHHFNYQPTNQAEKCQLKTTDGVNYVSLKTSPYAGNGLGRLKNMIQYACAFYQHDLVATGVLKKPDVIIISSPHPFHLLAGLKWAKRYQAKLVFEVRDLWPLSLNVILGVSRYHPLTWILNRLQCLGYRRSDITISLLSDAKSYMCQRGLDESTFLLLPNGINLAMEHVSPSRLEEQLSQLRHQYRTIIMHTGSMGKPNALDILVEVINAFKDNDSVGFIFIGSGIEKQKLISACESEHAFFFDAIAKSEIQAALKFADIGYCGYQNYPELYQYGISANKLFDYMLAKKPILLTVSSDNNPVSRAGAGIFCEATPKAISDALTQMIQLSPSELESRGIAGYQYLLEHHDFDKLAQVLLDRINAS